jgi:hypothetical protein
MYERSSAIFVQMTLAEFDVFCIALTLLDWSSIGIEKDEDKIRLIAEMREATLSIKTKF